MAWRWNVIKGIVYRSFISVFSTILILLLIEGGARVYLTYSPQISHVPRWEFRATRPPPYRNADYFNKDFLKESMECVTGVAAGPPGTHFIVLGDYRGKYCNVINGRRKTMNQPNTFKNKVLLFGASTVFCRDVPDNYTNASYLQALINTWQGPPLVVENFGRPSMNIVQQLEILRMAPINIGDIVIFYDGDNDVYYPVYNGNPRGWFLGDTHDGGVRQLNWVQRQMHRIFVSYGEYSAAVRMLFRQMERVPPANVVDRDKFTQNLDMAQNNYRNALVEAKRYVTERGGLFFHFLQPNIFNLHDRSAYEGWIIENELRLTPGIDKAFQLGYPRLQAACSEARAEGVLSFDLTKVLDPRLPGEEFYLDIFHINHEANKRIADRIFDLVFRSSGSYGP